MAQSQSREAGSHLANQEIPITFMEPKGLLLCSQFTTRPSLDSDESSLAIDSHLFQNPNVV
jgi:hypothetical protein